MNTDMNTYINAYMNDGHTNKKAPRAGIAAPRAETSPPKPTEAICAGAAAGEEDEEEDVVFLDPRPCRSARSCIMDQRNEKGRKKMRTIQVRQLNIESLHGTWRGLVGDRKTSHSQLSEAIREKSCLSGRTEPGNTNVAS
jgi:hypothetical protein